MNVTAIITELEAERDKIEQAIAYLRRLEEIHPSAISAALQPKKRGRKGMNTAQREEVSARMKRYWAGRRKARKNGNGNGKAEGAVA